MARRRKNSNELKCRFCEKPFKLEMNLIKHTCKYKLRWLDRETKFFKTSFIVYEKFFSKNSNKKIIDSEDFIKSKYYTSFTKFGRYVLTLDLKYPEDFVNYMIESGLPIDSWTHSIVYEEYILKRQNKEPWEAGLEKTIMSMQEWAERNSKHWLDFYFDASTPEITHLIRLGKISPWLIYTSSKAKQMIARMNEEQIMLIHKFIDSRVWKRRLLSDAKETAKLKQFILEHNL